MICYILPTLLTVYGNYCYNAKLEQLSFDISVKGNCILNEVWHVKPENIDKAAEKLALKIVTCGKYGG